MLTVDQIIKANNLDRELRKDGSALNERDLPASFVAEVRKRDKALKDATKDVFATNEAARPDGGC